MLKTCMTVLVVLGVMTLPMSAQRTTAPVKPPAPATANAPDNVGTAKAVVGALQANDYAKAESKFSPALAKTLPEAKLKTQWEAVLKQYGAMKEIKSAATTRIMNTEVVVVNCTFAKGPVDAQVGFDKEGRVSELYFKPGKK